MENHHDRYRRVVNGTAAEETFEIPAAIQKPTSSGAKRASCPTAIKEAKTPKEASTTSKPASADDNAAETAAASATASKQEKAKQPTASPSSG